MDSDLLKKEELNITLTEVFGPFTQNVAEAPLAAIAASGQALHLGLRIFFSAEPLQVSQVGPGHSVDNTFDWVLVGPLEDIHSVVPKRVPPYLGPVLRVTVLLEAEP